ncbi:MAG: Redox-sensitive transcriptional activator [uncultured bacterium]|nr:MAG: Redox-sensitive transcriptional activator [uncultured bacterium]OFW69341.1 MAG: hypothetical protein A2X70_07260 [Alphaproteobacteria bacterium GWC2_42_16]OFW74052.1 MAG: hypothetical protein A2Z80_07620 [Alphaproteobacteria bacterium GWA2_41_27]OFW83098.1 MAG: hypothetical protein A3E50_05710 [Alphaproteobacteria bacterium RIFCSPHIGHO2_12_FULL_42_100]OFW84594.1 MAG: hypothetical protein A2W06_07905 [Alphaproteobacteria bacterium RBG_16_42_14]OFW92015.1 MAG: hypothetical protein A3C41_
MILDWDKLRVFYHVAKAKSFNRAACHLNISQSSLSRSVQQLEYLLKVQLFNRVPKGLILTKQGQILFEKVKEMAVSLGDAETTLQEESSEPQGNIKVATTVALANIWLIEIIPDFLASYPKIKLDIIGSDEELDIKAREVDVSIRPFVTDEPDLVHEYLFSCCLQLYASPEYLQKFGCPQTVNDLDHHQIITFSESRIKPHDYVDWILWVGKAPGGYKRKPYIRINSSKGASRFAELGLGIVALSKEFPGIENMNLVSILPDVKGPTIDIYYAYPLSLKTLKRVQVFGEYLAKSVPKNSRRGIDIRNLNTPHIHKKNKIDLAVVSR